MDKLEAIGLLRLLPSEEDLFELEDAVKRYRQTVRELLDRLPAGVRPFISEAYSNLLLEEDPNWVGKSETWKKERELSGLVCQIRNIQLRAVAVLLATVPIPPSDLDGESEAFIRDTLYSGSEGRRLMLVSDLAKLLSVIGQELTQLTRL